MAKAVEIKALRALLKVAELRNISQAANALGLTQSSLSRAVGALERDFGAPLFYRTGRGVTLTDIGEEIVPRARNVVLASEQLAADVRDRSSKPSGLVTLALMPALTGAIAEPLFGEVRRRFPGIALRMLEGFSANIVEWLADGRADIGVLSRYGKEDTAHEEVLAKSYLMLVGAAPIRAHGASVRFRELAKLPLVLPAHPNGTRIAIDRAARKVGIKLDVAVETDSLEAQKAITLGQGCYTIADERTVQKELRGGQLHAHALVAPRIERRVVVCSTRRRPLSRAARQVIAIIREVHNPR